MTKPWTGFPELSRSSAENAEVIADILRALRRKKGFGLFFVQCSPAQGTEVIRAIPERLPQKEIVEIKLNRDSETLYPELPERYQTEGFEIACISGVEQTLYSYEDTKRLAGWTAEEIYNYSWKGVPPLLSHLNRQREMFEAHLPIRLVFLVPYEKILNTKEKIIKLDQSNDVLKERLLRKQGLLFIGDQSYSNALDCYKYAIELKPDSYYAWNNQGFILNNLKRYKEAIESIELKQDSYEAWNYRGVSLIDSGRYEEGIKSCNIALVLQSNFHYAWFNKGNAFYDLQQYEKAIQLYDKALELKPNYSSFWNNRALALVNLQRYKEAKESYDRAIELEFNSHENWNNRGVALLKLQRYEEAIESFDRALELQPYFYYAWVNKNWCLLKRFLHTHGFPLLYLNRCE